jgi:hypothetical protein
MLVIQRGIQRTWVICGGLLGSEGCHISIWEVGWILVAILSVTTVCLRRRIWLGGTDGVYFGMQ